MKRFLERRPAAARWLLAGLVVPQVLGCAAGWSGPRPPVVPVPPAPGPAPDPGRLPTATLWTYRHPAYFGAPPVAVGGFLALVDRKGKVTFLDPNSGRPRATVKAKYPLHHPPAWDDRHFYTVAQAPRRRLSAFRFEDGKRIWHRDFSSPPEPPIKAGEELWVAAGDTLCALSPGSGALLHVPVAGGGRWLSPVAGPGLFAVLSRAGLLRGLDSSGALLWETDLAGPCAVPPSATQDGFIVVTTDGRLVKVDSAGGERWRDTLGTGVLWTSGVREGRLYVIGGNGAVAAYEEESGARLWRGQLPAPGADGVCVHEDWLAVNALDGTLWFLDRDSGRVRDSVPFGELIHEPPVWALGRLLIVTENRKLHALGTGP